MHIFQTIFVAIGIGLLVGSYFVIDNLIAIGVGMRVIGFVALALSFIFRE